MHMWSKDLSPCAELNIMKPSLSMEMEPYTTVRISINRHSLWNGLAYILSFFIGEKLTALANSLDLRRSK